ncbi:MAG: AraC family transcriptional regulator [Lachnospiraceae bacterium]|nr:AraC family transcriptional regulator [Lachnospiraceae bacterium]
MEKAYKLEFGDSLDGSLYNTSCGLSKTEPLHSFGPAVKPFYIIHYVLSGEGRLVLNEKEYHLEKNYGFLITPEELAFYEADEKNPWTYVWVGFTGTGAEDTIKSLGLSNTHPVFYSEASKEIYEIVKKMMEYNTYSFADKLKRNGYLSLFLSTLSNREEKDPEEHADKGNIYVEKAIEFVRLNYCNPIKVTDIADYVCLNRSYLYTLFDECLHMSPHQFLTTYRITKSLELLHSTDYPIESIALSSGYSNAVVFMKTFKKQKGMSPTTYRKAMRSGGAESSLDQLKQLEDFIDKASGRINL